MATELDAVLQTIGNYGYLCLDAVALIGQIKELLPAALPTLPPPPLDQVMVGTPPIASAPVLIDSEQAAKVANWPWSGWFLAVQHRLEAITPGVAGQAAVAVTIEAPSIDETDADWYAKLVTPLGITDPVSFTPRFTVGGSRYGRTFQIGDYVLICDFDQYVDGRGVNQYRVEIAQIASISAGGQWTINRKGPNSPTGEARFGTKIQPHKPVGYIRIFRLIDQYWNVVLPSPIAPQLIKLPWDSMCVAAVRATAKSLPPLLLTTIPPASEAAVPGFRTLSGAQYTLGSPGTLALGSTSILRLSVAGWHSIRNAFFEFDGAAGTGASTKITLAYINPQRTAAYRVAEFTLPAGSRQSYTAAQQDTRFPGALSWPPNVALPLMTGALDADGVLQNGFTIDLTKTATLEEDGELDFIVTSNATTPGVSLRGTIQT